MLFFFLFSVSVLVFFFFGIFLVFGKKFRRFLWNGLHLLREFHHNEQHDQLHRHQHQQQQHPNENVIKKKLKLLTKKGKVD